MRFIDNAPGAPGTQLNAENLNPLLAWRGEYDDNTAYNPNDIVTHNNLSYRCKDESTGNLPANAAYWEAFTQTEGIIKELAAQAVPSARMINGHPLTGDITLTKADIHGPGAYYDYYCLGTDANGAALVDGEGKADNQLLSQLSKDFFNGEGEFEDIDDDAVLCIVVNGTVGTTANTIAGSLFSSSRPPCFFDFGVQYYCGKKKLYMDWSNAEIPHKAFKGSSVQFHQYALFYNADSPTEHINAQVSLEADCTFNITTISSGVYSLLYGFYGDNCTYNNCSATVKNSIEFTGGALTDTYQLRVYTYGFYGNCNKYRDCSGISSSKAIGTHYTISESAGFYGDDNNYINCTGAGLNSAIALYVFPLTCGFNGANSTLINCTLIALGGGAGYYSNATWSGTYHILQNCKFPLGVYKGYPKGAAINIIGASEDVSATIIGNIISDELQGIEEGVNVPEIIAGVNDRRVFILGNVTAPLDTYEIYIPEEE